MLLETYPRTCYVFNINFIVLSFIDLFCFFFSSFFLFTTTYLRNHLDSIFTLNKSAVLSIRRGISNLIDPFIFSFSFLIILSFSLMLILSHLLFYILCLEKRGTSPFVNVTIITYCDLLTPRSLISWHCS